MNITPDELNTAYQKYVKAWEINNPLLKGCEPPIPITRFERALQIAKNSRRVFEEHLCRGEINPFSQWMMIQEDEILGIPHPKDQRRKSNSSAFGFKLQFLPISSPRNSR